MPVKTNPGYWECDCDEEFVNPKALKFCPACGADADNSPDARTEDANKFFLTFRTGRIYKTMAKSGQKVGIICL